MSTEHIEQFLELPESLRSEVLRIARVLAMTRVRGLRFFEAGPRGGYMLQFKQSCECTSEYGHDPGCYLPIECYIDVVDEETGETFPFLPVDPVLTRKQIMAVLGVTTAVMNEIAPDLPRRGCWCVCSPTLELMRLVFADPDNPWPTRKDRRGMREDRKRGLRRPRRRHASACACKRCSTWRVSTLPADKCTPTVAHQSGHPADCACEACSPP